MTEGKKAPAKGALAPTVAGVVLLLGAVVFSLNVLFGVSLTGGDKVAAHGGGGGGGHHGGPPGGGKPGMSSKKPVRVVDVERGSLTAEQSVPGEVVAEKRAILRARNAGEVVKIRRRLGEAAEAGQLVVELEAGTLPAELKRAQAQLKAAEARRARAVAVKGQAERELQRKQRLAKDGAASSSVIDQARTDVAVATADAELADAEVDRAAADVDMLRVRLAQTRLRAPFDGRIASLDVEEGSVVPAGASVMSIVADAPPLVKFAVGEQDVQRVAVGSLIDVRLAGASVEGEVVRVGAAIDPESRTLPVEATLKVKDEDRGRVFPGAFVRVSIAMGVSEHAAVVPVEALMGRGPERTAFVVEDDVVKQVAARVLLEDGRHAAVSGLEVGQRVVVTGVDDLKDGAAVEVVQ